MKKIYLAGPCDTEHRSMMWKVATMLRENGHFEVYCPWEYQVPNAWSYSQEDWAAFVYNKDIMAIQNCDFFFMVSVGRESTAGTNWEQGYAYALGKTTIVVQVNDNSTSLMTYHGCDLFVNSNFKDPSKFFDDISYIIDLLDFTPSDHWSKLPCDTTLT